MTEVALFSAPRKKIARARQHVSELEALIAAHIKANPSSWSQERGEDGILRITVRVPKAPDGAGEIVGDIVHNLRAALDLMAVDLVRAQKGNTKSVYFPFCENENELDEMIKRRKFHRAGKEAVALLKQLAPYRGGNEALRALHDLDVQDKHHTLIPATSLATTPQVTVDKVDFTTGKAEIRVIDPGPDFEAFAVSFPDDSPFARKDIIPTLHELTQLVEGIVDAFSTIVPPEA